LALSNACRDGILEYYWGEHIHLGYYTKEERAQGYKKKDFKQAKFDFVDEMLKWSGATSPARILDVGCGIGGTSRHLAARFCSARVQGRSILGAIACDQDSSVDSGMSSSLPALHARQELLLPNSRKLCLVQGDSVLCEF